MKTLKHLVPPRYIRAAVNSEQEVEAFILTLREAAKNSRESGGLYTAFLHLKQGQVLAVEIGIPIEHTK